jgi:hypothetical protein
MKTESNWIDFRIENEVKERKLFETIILSVCKINIVHSMVVTLQDIED